MRDVTDICMKLKVPPKNSLNQLDQHFSSLTNDYNCSRNCYSMHSNTVAMDQCLDGMIDHIWKLRSRAIPYRGIQVKIGQGILSKCPNGQGLLYNRPEHDILPC